MNDLTAANNWRRHIYWMAGLAATLALLTVTEGTLIATTKMMGVAKATLLRVSFTIPISWAVIWLAARSKKSPAFTTWLKEKETKLSDRARKALNGGKFLAVVNAAVFLGPIIASIFMLMLGVGARRVYIYAVACAFLCAWFWCAFYGGMLWGIEKMILLKI